MSHVIGKGRRATETYPEPRNASGTPPENLPLSEVFYVDPHSLATGTPDGTDEHPFLTLQSAFDATFPGVNGREFTYLVAPCFFGADAGPLVLPDDLDSLLLSIVGLAGSNRSIETPSVSTLIGSIVLLGEISGAGGTSSNVSISFQDCTCNGGIALEAGNGGSRLSFDSASAGNVVAPGYDVLMTNCSAGSLTVGTIGAYISAGLSGGSTTWTADTISLDGTTHALCEINSVSLSVVPTILERAPQAVISVAVPVLAAGALGYANVSTVGSALEGIPADAPIAANPTTDLAAAGAGNGGFINARVSALNTIRCAFVGALAGGASDFLFSRVV